MASCNLTLAKVHNAIDVSFCGMKNCLCVVWKLSAASAFEHLHFECVNLFSAFSINFSLINGTSTQKRVFLGVEGFLGCSDPSWGFLTDKSV